MFLRAYCAVSQRAGATIGCLISIFPLKLPMKTTDKQSMGLILLLIAVLTYTGGVPSAASAGEIKGHLLVTKVLTKKRVALPNYELRGVPLPPQSEETSLVDEFSRSVVYLEDASPSSAAPVTLKLVQKNTRFVPEILVVPVGSSVTFVNSDPIFHNVFSLSKAKQFDLGYYPAGQSRAVKFDKPGVVQVYCHIHRDMNAAILVVPNESYVQPGEDGTFSLTGIPPGTHTVVVWHKSAGFFRRKIQVPENGSVDLTMTIPVPSAE